MARELPSGTVTFLFTDVEGSTRFLHQVGPDAYAEAISEHRRVLRRSFDVHGGVEVDTQGDSFFVAFSTAPAALAAAEEAQALLADGQVRVRMGIHTGTPRATEEGYVGADVHRAARIAAAGHGGQVLVSSSTAALIGNDTLRDLGDHRLKDLAAPERVYQLGEEAFPALRSLGQTNLPIPVTPFFGRHRELEEVAILLHSRQTRLLTLTGPAGAGKTRLALQAAAEASGDFPDGVFWVSLTAVREPQLIPEVIAQALDTKGEIAERIADRRLLLALDNFEHLIDGAGVMADLLASCPNLCLLVTSRELLRLPGEQAYPVPALESADATAFFTARARAVNPRFESDPSVAELCSRLDNLPLALELAAARVAVLTPEQLLGRLSQRLDLFKAGRGVDPRQQTLRATIAWSYDLLDEDEQLLFERLSIFRGGCTVEAAEKVCEAEIDTLQSLIEKSLLQRDEGRLRMLQTIREYAAEKLEERGAVDATSDRHVTYFLWLAERVYPREEDEEPELGRLLFQELDNLRRARTWLIETGDAERELRLATAAVWALWTRASYRELKGWLVSALERDADGDLWLRAQALGGLALATANLGEIEQSRDCALRCLALARNRDDQRQIEWALRVLSFDEPDLEKRRRQLQECERINRAIGNEVGLGWVTSLLGSALVEEERYQEARARFREASALFRRLGRLWEATNAELQAGYALMAEAEDDVALPIFEEALRTAVKVQSPPLAAEALAGVASARLEADPDVAARLLAAAWAIGEESGQPIAWGQGADMGEQTKRNSREWLATRYKPEWEAGTQLTLEEAVTLALRAE